MAGAVLCPAPLAAQDTTHVKRDTTKAGAKRDSIRIAIPAPLHTDSLLKPDSVGRARRDTTAVPKDTIKAPLAHAEKPRAIGIGRHLYWNRDSLFATGALTVQDLLERVPGLTTLRTGWLPAPAVGAYLGDAQRVRVFYDGVELDGLDPRAHSMLDLSQINLWSLEDATIDVSADEVRVYLRSWRVTNTSPSTRTDVSTGDQQTNLYRGFYGRRYDHGEAVQFAAQQYGTTPPSIFGSSSDQLGIIGRLGWAKGPWSVDAFATRTGRHRGTIRGFTNIAFGVAGDSIRGVESTRTDAYVRAAWRDPDTSPLWAQVLAATSKYNYTGVGDTLRITTRGDTADTVRVSLDTAVSRSQWIFSAGAERFGGRVSFTERLRAGAGLKLATPEVRASWGAGPLELSGFAQGKGADSTSRADVIAHLTPLSFISVLGSVGRSADDRVPGVRTTMNYIRGEGGVRVHGLWLLGGVIRRDSTTLAPPKLIDSIFVAQQEAPATGVTAAIRGRVWKAINADFWAVRWNDSTGVYRPRYQTRSELYVATNLIERFPTGNFGFLFSVVHEYRSGANFPTANGVDVTTGYRTISTLLEIRVLSAVVSWQFRNTMGERYAQVPAFYMPRQTNLYGVRWQFWN